LQRIGEKYLGKKHYINPLFLKKEKEKIKTNENYEKNLESLTNLVTEIYITKDESKKNKLIENAKIVISNQEFPS
jgi:hypothetical protein